MKSDNTCVTTCPDGTFADVLTGKCVDCDANCAKCKDSAGFCTECKGSGATLLFAPLGRCFTTNCPSGTWKDGTKCSPCKSSIINCVAGTGEDPAIAADKIDCDSSCAGCVFDSRNCIKCKDDTFKLTPDRRCITTACPENTFETIVGNDVSCIECSQGCLKCTEETNMLTTCTGGATARLKKCLRCDKDLGYYLYRDKCVKTCPVGTYADQVTGWCAECDCNCGSGGCIDRYICNDCPNPKMAIDPETGRCKCFTNVALKWLNTWQAFDIEISTKQVKFRDLTAEAKNASTNKVKTCRVGNEGSRFDSISEILRKEDMQITRCGETANTNSELEFLKNELSNVLYESLSSADKISNSVPTTATAFALTQFRGPTLIGQYQALKNTFPTTPASTVQTITDATGKCPAYKTQLSKADLSNYGLDSIDNGFYKYVQQLEKVFGVISIDDTLNYRSPLEGLKFTSNPTDVCSLLFDTNTYKNILDSPTCTLTTSPIKTTITVKPGIKSQIYPGYAIKFAPNVFVTECDWPVLTTHKITDHTSAPTSLDVRFDDIRPEILTCQDYNLKLLIDGAVGKTECDVEYEDAFAAASTTPLAVADATSAKSEIATSNASFSTTGVFKITAAQLTKLFGATAVRIRIKARCQDTYGQRGTVIKDVLISNGATTPSIKSSQSTILYDSSKENPISFEFDYINCATPDAKVTYTTILQKKTAGTYVDTTTEAEKITNFVIPKGLVYTTSYQVKVSYTAPGLAAPIVANVPLQFVVKKPVVNVEGFKTFIKSSDSLTFKFDSTNVSNAGNISGLGLSFSCTTCTSGKCYKKDGTTALVPNDYYTASILTFNIPADTLKAGECYTFGITALYQGESGTSSVNVKVAEASVTKALEVDFSFKERQFIDSEEAGFFRCLPSDNTIQASDFKVDSIALIDSSVVKITLPCITYGTNEIKYTAGCLTAGKDYSVSCGISLISDPNAKGQGTRSFTTQSAVGLTATISPTTGTHLTKFALTVKSTYTESVVCQMGVVGSGTEGGFTKIGVDFIVGASGTQTVNDIFLTPVPGNTATKIKIECKANVSGAQGVARVEATVTAYTGDDKVTQEKALTSTMMTNIEAYDASKGSANTATAKQLLESANSMSSLLGNLNTVEARSVSKNILKLIKNTTINTADKTSVKTVVKGLETFAHTTKIGGLDTDAIANYESAITSLFGSFDKNTSRMLQAQTQAKAVQGMIPKKGSDSVVQLEQTDCLSFASTLSKITEGIETNKDQITKTEYEKVKKLNLIALDKLLKSCISSLSTEQTLELPLKKFFFYAKKLSLQSAELAKEHELVYDCPCGSAYKATSTSSDPDVVNGKIDLTAAKSSITATKRTDGSGITTIQKQEGVNGKATKATAEGKCAVSIPALSKISTAIKGCTSVMVAVVTSDSLCPNAYISADDSNRFKVDAAGTGSFTTVSTTNANDIYQKLNIGSNTCNTTDYTNMQCTGPSIDVSFYCAKEQTVDATNKLSVERLAIDKIDGGSIKYSMNCPYKDLTFAADQIETPVFFNEYTGENSCHGCTQGTDGVVSCNHATTFGYARSIKVAATPAPATESPKSISISDWWEKIYVDYVLYLMIAIDLYFVIAFFYSLLKKNKPKTSKVVNISKNSKVESSRRFEGDNHTAGVLEIENAYVQDNTTGNEGELRQAGYCKKFYKGFYLKYRMITPFTTSHPTLSRLSRTFINVVTLYMIWMLSGIIVYGMEKAVGSFLVSIVVCFVVARLSILCLELIHTDRSNIVLKIAAFVISFLLLAGLHVSIFLLTNAMNSEFKWWGWVVLVVFFIDLVLWEVFSLLVQLCIGSKLAKSPDAYGVNRKYMELIVTPPLLETFMNV